MADVEITLTSSTGVLDQELELELEPIYTVQDILDYLQQNSLLRQPVENIVVKKDGNPVAMHVRLHMLIGGQAGDRVRIALETKSPSHVHTSGPQAAKPQIGQSIPQLQQPKQYGDQRGNAQTVQRPPEPNRGMPAQGFGMNFGPPTGGQGIYSPNSSNNSTQPVGVGIDSSSIDFVAPPAAVLKNSNDTNQSRPIQLPPPVYDGDLVRPSRPTVESGAMFNPVSNPPSFNPRQPNQQTGANQPNQQFGFGAPTGGPVFGSPTGPMFGGPTGGPMFGAPTVTPPTGFQTGANQQPSQGTPMGFAPTIPNNIPTNPPIRETIYQSPPVGGGMYGVSVNSTGSIGAGNANRPGPTLGYQGVPQQQAPVKMEVEPTQEGDGIELFLVVEDPNGKFDVRIKAKSEDTYNDVRNRVVNAINESKRGSETWEEGEEINVFWTEKLTSRFKKTDRAFSSIPGLIKHGRVTFRVEKAYPGGSS